MMKTIKNNRRLPVALLFLIALSSGFGTLLSAQPLNDSPCSPNRHIGYLNPGMTLTVPANISTNVNSAQEYDSKNISGGPLTGVLDCFLGPWKNSVYYTVKLDPTVTGATATLRPKGKGKFGVVFIGPMCPLPIYSDGFPRVAFSLLGQACSAFSGQTLTVTDKCLFNYQTRYVSDISYFDNTLNIAVTSPTKADQDSFELVVQALAPTLCDQCLNGDETEPDAPYFIPENAISSKEADIGIPNGSIYISEVTGGRKPLEFYLNGVLQPNTQFNHLSIGYYNLMVKDADGCTLNKTIKVDRKPPPPPLLSITSASYCKGEPQLPITAKGLPNSKIEWFDSEELLVPIANDSVFQPSISTTTIFYVTQTVDGYRSKPAYVFIGYRPIPSAVFTGSPCLGSLLTVKPNTEAVSMAWYLNDQLLIKTDKYTYRPEKTGNYKLVVSKGLCSDTASIQIKDLPQIHLGNDITICKSFSPLLKSVSQGVSRYVWAPAQKVSSPQASSSFVKVDSTTTFILTGYDENQCTVQDTITVFVKTSPSASFDLDSPLGFVPHKIKVKNTSSNATGYVWDFGDGTLTPEFEPEHIYSKEGTFSVTLTAYKDSLSCKDVSVFSPVQVTFPPIKIYTGLSPNGDGINDKWIIENLRTYGEHEVKVYNQWGNMVFSSTNYQSDWDGENVPDGTYYYSVKVKGETEKGYLTIIR